MYLSNIEIFGFKSFAQKTKINFNEGVTSIVGPNGCGKTNIVDAIRWCLGEQRSSALRSDKMENVIFNGTTNKKPMGMAEVSLSIENTKGILPTEYTDITITRRIFRSGESEYLLNKNLCRLKDITNLFMDTGIGANAYSVIELKMVETILSSRAEERRIMFEEAAGVNKYKLRRRLALRKLDEVKNDLTRVNDIVLEVAKNVRSLERQSKKADRYNRLSSTLKELEIDLAERELALFVKLLDDINSERRVDSAKKEEFDLQLAQLIDELNDIKSNLSEIEIRLKDKRSEVTFQTEKIYNVKNNISISSERKSALNSNIERYKAEIDSLQNQLDESREVISLSGKEKDIVTATIKQKEDEQKILQQEADSKVANLEAKKEELKNKRDVISDILKTLSDKNYELANVENALAEKKSNIDKLNDRVLHLTNDVAKTVGYIENLTEEHNAAAENLAQAETEYTRQQNEKEELENELNNLRSEELELKGVINSLGDKILFTQSLLDNMEGISKGTKSLLEDTSWAKGKVALLANAGTSSEKFRPAIEAALFNNLNYIISENLADVRSAIDYLKKNDLGRATLYLTDNKVNNDSILNKFHTILRNRKAKKLKSNNGFIGWADSVIKTEKNWKSSFQNILRDTAIVKNLDTAINLSMKYKDFRFVTVDGDYADGDGIIAGGSPPQMDESLFGKKQLLDELKKELPVRQKSLNAIAQTIGNVEKRVSNIDLKVLSEKGKLLVNDLANIDKQIAQFEFEKQKANDEIENTHKLVQQSAAEANEIDNKKILLTEEFEKIKTKKEAADEELNTLETGYNQFEKEYNRSLSSITDIKLEIERLSGSRRNLENSIEQAKKNINGIEISLTNRGTDIENAGAEISNLDLIIVEKEKELNGLEEIKNNLISEEQEIEKSYSNLKNHYSELESRQNKLRDEKDEVLDKIRDEDIKLSEIKIKKQNLIEHIDEEYSLQIEQKSFDDLDAFNFTDRKEEVHTLRDKIRNLGPINLLAFSEYEEEEKRLGFLNKQHSDLIESEKDLIKTIEEINITAETQFLDTFNQIRENFIKVFRTLFDPGDEVDLRLESDADPLEAKIEIIAKPKGKRPTSIELLSGGEKTLTAIALLFGIYLVKPSPFCILDEIDAPLDDANIDRFTRILREFSTDTQFVVVTHNKRTMESAETLYGVTMQEEGISKLVSVQFNEEFDFVA